MWIFLGLRSGLSSKESETSCVQLFGGKGWLLRTNLFWQAYFASDKAKGRWKNKIVTPCFDLLAIRLSPLVKGHLIPPLVSTGIQGLVSIPLSMIKTK